MKKPTIHLICNAHIDPVWLWEWEEGAGEALSTFRAAAAFCEEFDAFVFNHNEAILYQWVEEYESSLFARIQRLVRAGRWHIMGGWYLQPDCNMPSGESFVRQILLGKRYFREKFGVDVRTGSNLDPFGHSRGLVQILARSGYDSYIFCRPSRADCPMPADAFEWVGFDGSRITATLASSHYNSAPGTARAKVEQWMRDNPDRPCSLLPWGVGNHGGGPSRKDLVELGELIRETSDVEILHSTPTRYFEDLRARRTTLPRFADSLNPWAVGCYTSMMRIKHRHRALENALYMTEKMAATAAAQNLATYPRAELKEAACDLAAGEFHDALPGSSIEPVQECTLRLFDHGLEILSRVRARAFFALAAGQAPAADGEFPILVFNPHPYPVKTLVECELQPQWTHGTDGFMQPVVRRNGRNIPAQAEKQQCNINEDHRKRVVFPAVLEPAQMTRFDCRLKMMPQPPVVALKERDNRIRFKTKDLDLTINTRTGLLDRYRVGGVDYLRPGALRPLVIADNADPWGMTVKQFRKRVGSFKLMLARDGTAMSGVTEARLPSVRIIEDGPVRSVVEVMLAFNRSCICQRYKLPRQGTEIEIEMRIHWGEKDRMLKLSIPTVMDDAVCLGQVAYGVAELAADGNEMVAQKWVAAVSKRRKLALTCLNDATHGLDMKDGELRLSLLRSPAHAAHPTGLRPITVQDRYTPRIDQGEHILRFWLNAGPHAQRLKRIGREAQIRAERPFALSYCPPCEGALPETGITLSDDVIEVAALKYAEDNDDLIVRLFEPTGRKRTTLLSLPFAGAETEVVMKGFEIRTLRFSRESRRFTEVDLMEDAVK
ncbi:MAG: alpha-mannosidase [Phycisphaerales bacterium]|nr:MAG: alpha-mannosidase [Phycisphaerales bacterium]